MANDIKILDHLNIDLDGDGIAERYEIGGMSELPIASTEVLGGVKIGENLPEHRGGHVSKAITDFFS